MTDNLRCWICEAPSVGVCCSSLGAISGPYCLECLQSPREPWGVLVGALVGCERGKVSEGVQPIITATLDFYSKTEDELWTEIERVDAEYDEYLQREAQQDAD